MDDDNKKLNVMIDPQQDFNPATAAVDWKEKFRKTIKDIDFKKIMGEIPLKTMRHDKSIYDHEKINIILPPLDRSGSMGDLIGHEIPHIYKSGEDFGSYSKKTFGKGKIIVFDEMSGSGQETFRDYFNDVTAMYDSYRASQACGVALAEGFQQGVAQPVTVRRPLSFRPRACI